MRAIFFGTPDFAVPSLEALASRHTVLAVYTQPDRPKGRGRDLAASPVKQAALRLGLAPICQPQRVREAQILPQLAGFHADVMVVVGYGQIIPQSIIDLPRLGIINVHASLLPKYRGAAPIQWAIARGESTTGVTTMRIDAGLDTGDILLQRACFIGPTETAVDVSGRLAREGSQLLLETLAGLESGSIQPIPQNHAEATLAPILTREDGRIDWRSPARVIADRSRGFQPWPGAWTLYRGQRLNIWRCRPATGLPLTPGQLCRAGKRLFAACGEGTLLELLELQPEGRKRMSAEAFLNGVHLDPGDCLG
jgi:methionyl-tRNA formyltransferase